MRSNAAGPRVIWITDRGEPLLQGRPAFRKLPPGSDMTHRSRLKLASLIFAAFWTIWMVWSLSPLHPVQIGLLAVSGALAGLGWYCLCGSWYRWHFAGRILPRRRLN